MPGSRVSAVPCPAPVAASEPKSSTSTDATWRSERISANSTMTGRAARIGPVECELEGPIPIVKRSKMLSATRTPSSWFDQGFVLHRAEKRGRFTVEVNLEEPAGIVGLPVHACRAVAPGIVHRDDHAIDRKSGV